MKQGHILVVDDLPDVRNTVTGMLSDEGYFVSSASSREEALQKLDAEHFNVAVLDVRLDDSDEANQDGLRLMYDISKKDPTTAVIILTGYADVKMVQEALRPNAQGQSPAFDFLEKSEIEDLPKYVNLAFEYSSKISKNDPQNEIEQALLDSLQTHLADMGQYNIMVEGQTDKAYLELAAQRFYEETKIDLLENGEVHIISTDGTKKLGPLLGALQSLEKQGYHFVFIFDGDDVGRRAADGMHRFHAQKNRQFFQLERTEFKDKSGKSWDVEIEDLISWPLVESFITKFPEAVEARFQRGATNKVVIQGQPLEHEGQIYDYKEMLVGYAHRHATLDDLNELVRVLKKARQCMGLRPE